MNFEQKIKTALFFFIMIAFPIYQEGWEEGIIIAVEIYIAVALVALAGWIMWRLATGTWSLERLHKGRVILQKEEDGTANLEDSDDPLSKIMLKVIGIGGLIMSLLSLATSIYSFLTTGNWWIQ